MPAPASEPPPIHRASRRRPALAIVLGGCLVLGQGGSAAVAQLSPSGPQAQPKDEFSLRLEQSRPGFLDRVRSVVPEWVAMTIEILKGDPIQPGKGWFVRGKSLTRFPWPEVVARLDSDRNGLITRPEFPGPDADFRRLDRDGSRSLTKDDFEFPSNAIARSRSRMIMSFADRDRDGRIKKAEYFTMIYLATRDEITRHAIFANALADVEKTYEASVKEGFPYLSIGDLRETVDLAGKLRSSLVIPNVDGDFEVGPPATLLKALVRRDVGSLHAGPDPGEQAPDFTLPTDDGRDRIGLAKLLGKRPVVLIFGNYTSAGCRIEAGTLEKLYQRYRTRAEFLFVYTREEHPSDGWVTGVNLNAGIAVPQPKDDRARAAVAQQYRKKLGLALPMVVDSVDDRVGILYSGMPDRLYLLDPQGAVAYKGGRGPFGFKPDELEQALLLLLQAEAAPDSKGGTPPPPKAP